jgi:hypothetical protein
MNFEWVAWSNPVAVWWGFLLAVSAVNVGVFALLHSRFRRTMFDRERGTLRLELLMVLCAAYVFGCAFRSVLPRADVQRICLFDTWLSSVIIGRSVATIAELCFVAQWAIVLHQLAKLSGSHTARNIAFAIVPLIMVAETSSWYAVITTDYLGNTIENSIWAATFLLIAAALIRLMFDFSGAARLAMLTAVCGIGCYVGFLLMIDVPMYFARWQADLANGKELLGLFSGLYDLATRWAVTHDPALWRDEIAWMSLYFSAAVWSSLALYGIGLFKDRLPDYHCGRPVPARR